MEKKGTTSSSQKSSASKDKFQPFFRVRGNESPIPAKCNPELERLVAPHVDSFNYFLSEGLKQTVSDLERVELENPLTEQKLTWWIDEVQLSYPVRAFASSQEKPVFPQEVHRFRQDECSDLTHFSVVS